MPTINAGASATVSLDIGESIVGNGTGTAVLGPGPQAGQQFGLAGVGWRVGPYDRAQAVYVTAVTAVSYEEETPGSGGAVPGAGIPDASSLTLTSAEANTTRVPAGALTYTVNGSTGWAVGDGAAVFLPASGTVSFAASGATINGAGTTLTRTLAGNAIGYVVLSRIAGTNAYSLSGA